MSQYNFSDKDKNYFYDELLLKVYLSHFQSSPKSENPLEQLCSLEVQNKSLKNCIELQHQLIQQMIAKQSLPDERLVIDILSLSKRKFSILLPPMTAVEIIRFGVKTIKTIVWAIVSVWGIRFLFENAPNLDSICKLIKSLISGGIMHVI